MSELVVEVDGLGRQSKTVAAGDADAYFRVLDAIIGDQGDARAFLEPLETLQDALR